MPICPGCEAQVSYEELDSHQRGCRGIWVADSDRTRRLDWIEAKLNRLEATVGGASRERGGDLSDRFERRSRNTKRRLRE